jgi:hypothetical protein
MRAIDVFQNHGIVLRGAHRTFKLGNSKEIRAVWTFDSKKTRHLVHPSHPTKTDFPRRELRLPRAALAAHVFATAINFRRIFGGRAIRTAILALVGRTATGRMRAFLELGCHSHLRLGIDQTCNSTVSHRARSHHSAASQAARQIHSRVRPGCVRVRFNRLSRDPWCTVPGNRCGRVQSPAETLPQRPRGGEAS